MKAEYMSSKQLFGQSLLPASVSTADIDHLPSQQCFTLQQSHDPYESDSVADPTNSFLELRIIKHIFV